MILLHPYDDFAAHAVLSRLDPFDFWEAELTRGVATNHLALFADWRAMEPHRIISHVAHTGPDRGAVPFAVFALINTGQAGVAAAAMLARDHAIYRRPMAELAITMRAELPGFAAKHGIHRIEARAWAGHPTASRLLYALGFRPECSMPGFGADGAVVFHQFAWVTPAHIARLPQPDQIHIPSPETGA